MPTYQITAPDGRKFRVTGEGSKEDALTHFQSRYQQPVNKPPAAEPANTDAVPYDQGDEFGKKALRVGREAVRVVGRGLAKFAGAPLAPELQPQNATEAFGDSVVGAGSMVAGGLGIGRSLMTAGNQAIQRIGSVLASNPGMQVAGAVTGPAASEIARQSGVGETGQAIAGMAGAVAPGLAVTGAAATTRGMFRGGEQGRQRTQANLNSFSKTGATPSVGQATESRFARGAESLLSRTPGGAGQIVKKAEAQADELAVGIERRASQLAGKTSGEQTGRQIQRSIAGEGGFVDRFKVQQEKLYDQLDNFFPKSRKIEVESTRKALHELNQDIEGAKALSQWFKNARIKGINEAFKKDTAPPEADLSDPMVALQSAKSVKELDSFAERLKIGAAENPSAEEQALEESFFSIRKAMKSGKQVETEVLGDDIGLLPYEAVKKLRTLVGREMADAGIASDVPRSKWKALYAALSDDLGVAVEDKPVAKAKWARANNYTRAGMKRIETIESVIDKAGGPEAIFRAATANTKEGATTLRAVMQSMDTDGKKMISATVLRRLGVAKPGAQGELGDKFSTETFLTNWNTLSREAKATLFDRYGPRFRSDMDQIAKVTANLREGSQVFRNPSGTAQAATQTAAVTSLAVSIVTGNFGAAGLIGGGVAGANLSARLMTNLRFVRWLAQTTKAPTGAYVTAVASLANTARQTGDEDLALAVAALEQQGKQENQNKGRRQD